MRPDAGEILVDGLPFFRRCRPGPAVHLPARQRRVGYVFQHYALFPHMTALENVAYPLWRQNHASQRALALLERMSLGHVAGRYPHEMSGGQQQRVVIARALAAGPKILLLDEPFSALDAAIRERLQQDLRRLQAEENLIIICVTHNLDDAFAVGHRLAVMREGRIEQIGPLEAVLRRPSNSTVLAVLGIPNVFVARVAETGPGGLVLDWDGLRLEAPPHPAQPGQQVTAYIRPEDIKILYPDRPAASAVRHNQIPGRIVSRQPTASFQTLQVFLPNGRQVEVRYPDYTYTPLSLGPGDEVQLSLRKEALALLQPHPDFS
jgi:molybdate transport system ATP-binding protein